MSRHLALVEGTPDHPHPGYRWSRAHDKCQKCGRRGGPVRTVGMRRPEAVSWTWLVLCEPCTELGHECGWPMVAAVQPDPLAELREALALPLEEPPPEVAPPSSPRLPVTVAKYPSRCPACGQAIGEGDPIALAGKRWQHARCAS